MAIACLRLVKLASEAGLGCQLGMLVGETGILSRKSELRELREQLIALETRIADSEHDVEKHRNARNNAGEHDRVHNRRIRDRIPERPQSLLDRPPQDDAQRH